MDKNTAIGFGLIFFLMLGWFYFTMPSEEEIVQQKRDQIFRDSLALAEQSVQDSLALSEPAKENAQTPSKHSIKQKNGDILSEPAGIFSNKAEMAQTDFTIHTPLYTAVFTNKGAGPSSFTLNDYKTWDGRPVQLISDTTKSAYNIGFLSTENYNVETEGLFFEQTTEGSSFDLKKGESKTLSYTYTTEAGQKLVYTYTLYADVYEIDLDIQFIGLSSFIVGRSIDFGWKPPLNFTERDKTQDALATSAYVYAGGELEQFKLKGPGRDESAINGKVDWAATKTKFFAQLIKPTHKSDGATLTGEVTGDVKDPLTDHYYSAFIRSNLPSDGVLSYKLYIGPMKYYEIRQVEEHAFDMVEVGYKWLRWFSNPFVRFLVIPFFTFFSKFINNYGVLVIIFASLVKLILTPLTMKSYKSMAAMKELQPLMQDLQAKYKDNPQKLQEETMKLYKKNKVNPMGGCLPNLIQFPILITLWRFFQNSILLRQQPFLWASDLSAPDYIISLPFKIPIIGNQIAGFVLFMTAAMIVQSKLTGGASSGGGGGGAMAQQMKIMQYMLPAMMLFFFNNFASGLSLYYLVFNVLSIAQQYYINRTLHAKKMAEAAVVS